MQNNSGSSNFGKGHIPGGQTRYDPCNNRRSVTDVAGRFADLVNCYLLDAGQYIKFYLPLAVVAVILLAIMLIAAREALK